MVISRPYSIIFWCCFIPSVLGIINSLIGIFMLLNFFGNCRIMVWIILFNISFTMISNSLILLQKAYLVLCRQRWILYISTPFIMAQLFFAPIIIYYSFSTLEEKVGCIDYYPQPILWYWFLINVPINILFSYIFCHIALKQYRLFGSDAWKKLARDGIQAMTLATLCNTLFSIFSIMPISKAYSDDFFIIAWWVMIGNCLYKLT
ncbi:hypothetical protein BDF19DRAFT_437188 [Syncephalis fuscata]|nr:hypothetical protein BDF19DRAFT_437188 [Syncephalis fuscata]